MRVLISGAGVAGCTLAFWLLRAGFEPTLVERAPALRTGGYVIDFFGPGYDVAERMGVLDEIWRLGYDVHELRIVDADGGRIAGVGVSAGRYVSVRRGDLAGTLFGSVKGRAETIFGDAIAGLEQRSNDILVRFVSGVTRSFDLVVGADGLHSGVRALTFGPAEEFERYLGIRAAAFHIEGYQPRDKSSYVLYTEVGRQAARLSLHDGRTAVLMTFLDADGEPITDPAAQRELIRRRFAGAGWECAQMLAGLDRADDLYFDSVSQVVFEPPRTWSKGRVVLAGDAASCISLLGGEGSSLAMTAAYLLAGELAGAGSDHAAAFRRYEEQFRPYIHSKQRAARRYAATFAPKSRLAISLRNLAIGFLGVPWVGELFMTMAFKRSDFALPRYPFADPATR